MSIDGIRFRAEEGKTFLVLQVLEIKHRREHYLGDEYNWRDAGTEDLLQVAKYTRAYDALDKELSSIRNEMSRGNKTEAFGDWNGEQT